MLLIGGTWVGAGAGAVAAVEIKKEFTQIAIEARRDAKRLPGFCYCGLGKVPAKVASQRVAGSGCGCGATQLQLVGSIGVGSISLVTRGGVGVGWATV